MKNIDAITLLAALSHETRLIIFRLLVQKGKDGMTPGELREYLNLPNATLSFHLKELSYTKLVFVERQSRNLIYSANLEIINDLTGFLLENCCGGRDCNFTI